MTDCELSKEFKHASVEAKFGIDSDKFQSGKLRKVIGAAAANVTLESEPNV